jgi:protein tyrosine phosphatase (PTP) superfamily phosphohydrolase (DUF442 family)
MAMAGAAPSTSERYPSVATTHLPNAHRVTEKIYAGAEPDGEQGFKDVAAMGVKTILSVDGAKPDVELAHRFGLRYVHLPIGYDGVSREQGERIAKALQELPGPIYVHCHHGKHRSAAAVAVACVFNGSVQPEQAEPLLRLFGTGENYIGLWRAAREAKPLDEETLAGVTVKYVEMAKIPALAERMVAVDETFDRLKLIQKNGWKTPSDHPDLDPPHEALQLEEHFKEAGRTDGVKARPEAFRKLLSEGGSSAAKLRESLEAKTVKTEAAEGAFKNLGASCASCHKRFRD